MTKDWASFIQLNLEQSTQSEIDSGNSALYDLSSDGLIVIAGPDAVEFMQGQFTNDVKFVDESTMQLNAFCNNKGRMLANFSLFQYQGNYFMVIPRELIDSSIEHLSKYVLQAQVAIQDISSQLVHFGVNGQEVCKKLSDVLSNNGMTLATDKNAVTSNEDYIIVRNSANAFQYDIFSENEKAQKLWNELAEVATVSTEKNWALLNIQAGIPVITTATSGAFVPQMANMDRLDAVNFKKGCYTGQEIVARMHYLGTLKKRMYKIHISNLEDKVIPVAGDTLSAENARAGQNTGMIINAQKDSTDGINALAVIQNATIDSKLHLSDYPNATIRVEELPYSLSDSDSDSE